MKILFDKVDCKEYANIEATKLSGEKFRHGLSSSFINYSNYSVKRRNIEDYHIIDATNIEFATILKQPLTYYGFVDFRQKNLILIKN